MAESNYARLIDEIQPAPDYGTNSARVGYARGVSTEFFQLCDKITTNLFSLNKYSTTLEKGIKQIGTQNDNQLLRDRITQVNGDAGNTIQDTTNLLRSVHSLTQLDKKRKIRVQRLQTEFQAAATRFSEIQRKTVSSIRTARLPSDMVAMEQDEQASQNADDLVREGEQQHARKKALQTMEYEIAMNQEREQRVKELESDIININDIMKELSHMVADQGETIGSIEENIDHAHGNVEEGREELIKAAAYQSKYRRRVCLLILILIVVIGIIGIILGIHYSK